MPTHRDVPIIADREIRPEIEQSVHGTGAFEIRRQYQSRASFAFVSGVDVASELHQRAHDFFASESRGVMYR